MNMTRLVKKKKGLDLIHKHGNYGTKLELIGENAVNKLPSQNQMEAVICTIFMV